MNDTSRGDIRIAGAGTVATGTYRTVSVSGSATITGDVDCTTFKVNGAADGGGSIHAETIVVNGSLSYRGDAEAEKEVKVNGTATFHHALKAGRLYVAGTADVGGDAGATEVDVRGYLKVAGNCDAERFTAQGGVTVGGLLNAGVVDITLWAPCEAGEIGGESVVVRYGRGSLKRLVAKFVPGIDDRLTAESIEGDDVRLEHTTAKAVRGKSVVIGSGCDIGLVEYGETYSAAPDAKVKEARKVGESEENR